MTITWTTLQEAAHSGVLYGTEKPEIYASASQKAFVDGGEEQRVTYMHTVTLKKLQSNTSYVYKIPDAKDKILFHRAAIVKRAEFKNLFLQIKLTHLKCRNKEYHEALINFLRMMVEQEDL
ncbi:hypothetical protein ACTXT7_001681 [Hymenolepis weldensis]